MMIEGTNAGGEFDMAWDFTGDYSLVHNTTLPICTYLDVQKPSRPEGSRDKRYETPFWWRTSSGIWKSPSFPFTVTWSLHSSPMQFSTRAPKTPWKLSHRLYHMIALRREHRRTTEMESPTEGWEPRRSRRLTRTIPRYLSFPRCPKWHFPFPSHLYRWVGKVP